MRSIKSFFALGLALCLTAIPVYAEDVTITSAGSQSIEVTATVGSSFEVTIPKVVTLSNANGGTETYEVTIPVTVKGDIPTNEVITVDTSDTVRLTNTANTSVTETVEVAITKGKTEFDFDALTGGQTATTSHAVAVKLTPGTWEGTATFSINLEVPEIKYTNLLFRWEPADGYENTSNSNAFKIRDAYLSPDVFSNSVKVIYTTTDNAEAEFIVGDNVINTTCKFDGYTMFNAGRAICSIHNIANSGLSNITENGMYVMSGTDTDSVITIDGVSYGYNDITIEIYGPVE